MANIYASNEDNIDFFLDFFDHLTDFNGEDIITGGDYNLELDLDKDKRGGLAKTHQNSSFTNFLRNSIWLTSGGFYTLIPIVL